jgi:hypothetical protein
MSTNDREPRVISADRPSPLFERRVDPGVNTLTPKRVDPPSKLSTQIPRGRNMTGEPGRIPVKR